MIAVGAVAVFLLLWRSRGGQGERVVIDRGGGVGGDMRFPDIYMPEQPDTHIYMGETVINMDMGGGGYGYDETVYQDDPYAVPDLIPGTAYELPAEQVANLNLFGAIPGDYFVAAANTPTFKVSHGGGVGIQSIFPLITPPMIPVWAPGAPAPLMPQYVSSQGLAPAAAMGGGGGSGGSSWAGGKSNTVADWGYGKSTKKFGSGKYKGGGGKGGGGKGGGISNALGLSGSGGISAAPGQTATAIAILSGAYL